MVNVRLEAVRLVQRVFQEGAYTNILLNQYFHGRELEDLDRRFLTELVYGTVKAKGTLDWYLEQVIDRPLGKVEPLVLADLRVGMFQILYMDKVPEAAAVHEAVEVAKAVANPGVGQFVNGVLRSFLRKRETINLPDKEAERLGIEFWHPKELVKKWLKYYGREATEKLCAFNNAPAPLCIRVNTLKCTREELAEELKGLDVEFTLSKLAADGIVCSRIPSMSVLQKKLAGKFYVQDESSMLVAALLAPHSGDRVLDLCAAPGGKTTHLAQLMQNKGEVVACDVHPHKLPLIETNARSLGIDIIKTELNDATKLREDFLGGFDKVLVDAPCSGMGVLRRRAEARWCKKREDLKVFPPLQLSILANAAQYVKSGGVLVYSTCTIEQSENHYVVAKFLEEQPQFHLELEKQLLPQVDGVDGFYMARLIKD